MFIHLHALMCFGFFDALIDDIVSRLDQIIDLLIQKLLSVNRLLASSPGQVLRRLDQLRADQFRWQDIFLNQNPYGN